MVHNVRFGWMVDRYVGCLLGRLRWHSASASYGGLSLFRSKREQYIYGSLRKTRWFSYG
jgi:hypothetical protein